MKELNPQSQWDDEGVNRYIETASNRKEIGRRQVLGAPWDDGPFIEFYAEPPIRFNFASVDEYHAAAYTIAEFGWMLFDLS